MSTPTVGIQITATFQDHFVVGATDSFRVTVTATKACGTTTAIFAYRMLPLQPGQAEQIAVFDHVCSPVDLADYPLGAPRVNEIPPWFRMDTVTYDVATREEALQSYNDILEDVAALVRSLNNSEIMTTLPPLWIGTPCSEPSPGSSTGSSEGSSEGSSWSSLG